jgi:antitoxin component of MazEF toxin-antitoxin module
MIAQGFYGGLFMAGTYRTKVKKVGRSSAVILPKKFMDMLHWSDSEKVDVTPMNDGFLVKPSSDWSQEKQAAGFKKAFEMIAELSEEEKNMLPSGLEFEKEYRIKWRDTSDIDKKLDEIL